MSTHNARNTVIFDPTIFVVFIKSYTSVRLSNWSVTKTTPKYIPGHCKSIKQLVLKCYAIQFTGMNLIRIIHTMAIRESTGMQCMLMMCEHNAGQNHGQQILSKRGKILIFGNNTNKSKFHAQRYNEQIKLRESMPPTCMAFYLC